METTTTARENKVPPKQNVKEGHISRKKGNTISRDPLNKFVQAQLTANSRISRPARVASSLNQTHTHRENKSTQPIAGINMPQRKPRPERKVSTNSAVENAPATQPAALKQKVAAAANEFGMKFFAEVPPEKQNEFVVFVQSIPDIIN